MEIPKISYNGKIREVTIGSGDKTITVGGETCLPFNLFEGKMPHPPIIAMEVPDSAPTDWPEVVTRPFVDVLDNPVNWAAKCIREYGADIICLHMVSTDPNGMDRGADEAAEVARQVANSIGVPLIVWGTANEEKDAEVLGRVCDLCQGRNIAVGPVEEKNYKKIAPAALAHQHTVIASSPIDVNLAKQLNILLAGIGIPDNSILIDPTVSGIGYGIEYSYSVMERIRLAALTQGDEKLQQPIIVNIGKETWKTKEAREEMGPSYGDTQKRGVLLEAMSASLLLIAGADILVMRHPEAIDITRRLISRLMEG